ncbi:bifunctional diaminohydroxyphosphoribosylaminopyrimidine deaminase/5-amino-6-(5-phosphoribosylamino)uracil reductase RibD [Ferruginivarius sediminum]|uniref:Riboflavin biosynthesis protein RibD n=1 Tax=Ferruginivarius sediminum TaxID=2661937 RepID=A0A369TG42_9PROT|nr:bifunctional diaminohydroxyphosphoribosylaminopyrimidine deaminase/5-amino-6-(5-phosphoribosylamino)uracil reductase RibD [Ferruginivarius sediminum]RDD63782.1 bifunctional diaminohydroxyphosphoribosylaminopyrimidine deaminase/5-amino-6-(5-phosphoribosylamino)uracil reductase RibD [Ferruginivarius sediminum]
MRAALGLARRGLGRVAPNPAVGCVLVKDGRAVGRGWTQPGGRPHAETEALARAGEAAKGATAYVTLEPCSHHGRTPPCADALVEAGIARCVVALEDPDPRVAGHGLDRLCAAGIEVTRGVMAEQAAEVNAGYLLHRRLNRPMVTLKLATTLDGRIATRSGESRWITGALSRSRVHLMRAEHDAVMVGGGTAVADDPRLDVRLPGLENRKPLRVVLDGRLRLPLTHNLVTAARAHPTLLITRADAPKQRRHAFKEAGVEVAAVETDAEGGLSLSAILHELAARGLTRVLAEGGGMLAAGLLRADLVDRLAWFRAGKVIGGDGIPALAGFGLEELARAPTFAPDGAMRLGPDVMESYRRAV